MSIREARCPKCGAYFRGRKGFPFINQHEAARYCPICHPITAKRAGVKHVILTLAKHPKENSP